VTVRILRGGRAVDAVDPGDRGLAYGDGVFETILVHRGRPVWWEAHAARLAAGAVRLGIPLPDAALLRAEADACVAGIARGVLKLILTRGSGGRGYSPPVEPVPTMLLSLHDAPPAVPAGGLALRWCDTPLAVQPRLAGIKHLNRLEQVLARGEWRDPDIHEGLMCDTQGWAVCATAANLFVRLDGQWWTPPVDRCGIAGVCRSWLMAHADAGERELSPDEVERAEAVFLCNSVRGILPVARLGARRWPPDAATSALIERLAAAEPAFATAGPETV
jgi:4-amino-4-deoxychorismate lyase